MRTTNKLAFLFVAAAAWMAQGCQDDHYYCGDGTTAVDGYCEGNGGDCGPGTHEEGGQCVLDQDVVICGEGTTEVDGECVAITETGLPPVLESVTSPTPYPGGGLMVLQGDNFMLSDSGTMHVTVGGVETTNVQVLSNNYLLADLPASAIATVEVGIENDLGDDAMDFHYTGIYAAQGGEGKGLFSSPELHVIDPRDGTMAVVGVITSDGGTVDRPLTAMAFDDVGTLWGIDAVARDTTASLMTIDRYTGAATEVAVVNGYTPPLVFGGGDAASFSDMVFLDDVLYAVDTDADLLVSIDIATGARTNIGPINTSARSLVAADDGTLIVGVSDYYLEVIETDGTYVGDAYLDNGNNTLTGLTWVGGKLVGGRNGLTRIDPVTMVDSPLGPDDETYDAVATPPELDGAPGPAPDVSIITTDLRPAPVDGALVAADAFAPLSRVVTVDTRGRRGVALSAMIHARSVTIRGEEGDVTLDRDELAAYRLVENKRGQLKLVDADGRAVLRGITSIE